MDRSSRKIGPRQSLIGVLAAITMLSICSAEDFFDRKPTQIQSDTILRELSQVKESPDVNTPIPDVYLAEPKIISTQDGVKLFYFCKHHTVDKVSGILKEQLSLKVSQNPATNQLIIHCKTIDEAKATIDFLKEVDIQPIQVKISCLVSQIYADKTMDWETSILIKKLFGEAISLGGKEVGLLPKEFWPAPGVPVTEVVPAFPGASLRTTARAKMGLKIGYWKNSGKPDEFRAVVDVLESQGYLKILMNPTIEVINGRKAMIRTSESVPVPKEVTIPQNVYPYLTTEYKDVIDSLEVTPHVFGDGSIGLETRAEIGSKNTPEGVKQIPILTKREINIEENRIRPGDSLIIGGIKKSERFAVVRGVPLLKDIPLLGILFSSKDFEERATEIMFILTPSISTGGAPHKEAVEQLKEKHSLPLSQSLRETIIDPLGLKAQQMEQQRKIEQATNAQKERETEKTMTQPEAMATSAELEGLEAKLREATAKAEQVEGKQAQNESQPAKGEAQKAVTEAAQKPKEKIDKPEEEAAKPQAKGEQPAQPGEQAKEDSAEAQQKRS